MDPATIDQVRLNFNPQGLMVINGAIGPMMLGGQPGPQHECSTVLITKLMFSAAVGAAGIQRFKQ